MIDRRFRLALVTAFALSGLAGEPGPASVARGGALFTCTRIPLYFWLHPDRGMIPAWILHAFMYRTTVCA